MNDTRCVILITVVDTFSRILTMAWLHPVLPACKMTTFIVVAALFCVSYITIGWVYDYNPMVKNTENLSVYLVDTPVCKIPKMDPYDDTIRSFVRKFEPLTCPSNRSLTYTDDLQLRINWTAINLSNHKGNVDHCRYTPVYRPKYIPTSKGFWKYLDPSEPFNGSVAITDDFVRVDCFNTSGDQVYTNFHAFIQPNITTDEELKKRFNRHVQQDNIKERLNVILVGIDGVSRLNFMRQMVKTRTFLLETMGAVDMMGYNKVADNTFPNIVPLTLGKSAQEISPNGSKFKKPFDNFNFIWKQYSDKGYRTFFAEDYPGISTFDYVKPGFAKPPTDYFYRPITLAMEKQRGLWSNKHRCFQGRGETEMGLDYLYQFIHTFQHDPHFAFAFITRNTHSSLNGPGTVDETYYKFFKKLHENNLIRNTIVFFFSDHGFRYGGIRNTFIGMMEERLPVMLVTAPRWLTNNYKHIQNNLQINRKRLSTPFDVYETMEDILNFNGVQHQTDKYSRGIGWFREIPTERSCDQAGISPHWCTCMGYVNLQVTNILVQNVSYVTLAAINDMLANDSTICETLKLSKINEASKRVESEELVKLRKEKAGKKYKEFEYIQVVITTSPGNAMFEATVRTDSYQVVGDISRINKYGNQSDCINDFKLKKFCYCRKKSRRTF